MSMYDKTHYNIVISLQLKKKKEKTNKKTKQKKKDSMFGSSANLIYIINKNLI